MIGFTKSRTVGKYKVYYVNNGVVIGSIFQGSDGFYLFEFDIKRQIAGVFSQRFFKLISDKLQDLNKDYSETLSAMASLDSEGEEEQMI